LIEEEEEIKEEETIASRASQITRRLSSKIMKADPLNMDINQTIQDDWQEEDEEPTSPE